MENKELQSSSPPESTTIDYEKIAASEPFQHLVSSKRKLLVPLTVFFLVFYFALPFLTSFTKVLNNYAIGDISWAWIFAFAQFIMTWTLCTVYVKKANKFDDMAGNILEEYKNKESNV